MITNWTSLDAVLSTFFGLFTPAMAGNAMAAAIAGIAGVFIGSFLNVVIHRFPKMLHRAWDNYLAHANTKAAPHTTRYNLLTPRSCCVKCNQPISAIHNIPVISYVMLMGHCAHCKAQVSLRYPLVEVLTGALSAYIVWHFGSGASGLYTLLFIYTMIALCFIDAETLLLPDPMTLSLLWLGLIANINGTFVPLEHAVIGAIAGYLSLWSIYWVFKLITGKEGMGYGDFKLFAAIGAWLGWQILPVVLLLAAPVAAIIGTITILVKKTDTNYPIPFGPYLAITGVLALLYGNTVLHFVYRFFQFA
jgi:leader peptidase (prepilin peptidase)/N-methyltransferase